MKKLFYLIGLPICFVALAAATFLIHRTYESVFIIACESEEVVNSERTMSMNRPENYDLGIIPTENMMDENSYGKILHSDPVIQALMNAHVRTLDGEFEGSYLDYCLKGNKKAMKTPKMVDDSLIRWKTLGQEMIKKRLIKSIKTTVDFETEFATIKIKANDPLVATMLAQAAKKELMNYIEAYRQQKMELALTQLRACTEHAKSNFESHPNAENEAIYKSFARQEVVYQAQMQTVPSFAVLSEPSFSFIKVAPSRWKMPLVFTLLIGAGFWCWENRKKLTLYV